MRVLAVDFGTSNTVAALAVDGGAPRLLAIDGSPLVPSSVFLADDGTLAVGRDADRQARLDPARFEPNPKRRIDDGDILLGSTPVPVVTAIAAVLRRVAGEVTRQLGGPADEVRLTHPARWGRRRRSALVAAAREAGLAEDPQLIPEPVAAATHFATLSGHGLAEGGALAVYDLGGGTFDAAVVRRRAAGSGYEVLAEAGLPDLGGLDFDQAILEHIGRTSAVAADPAAWARLLAPDDPASRRAARALATDIRDGKEALSRYPHVDIALPAPFADVHLTRSELDDLIRGDLRRSVDLVSRTIADAGLGPGDLAGVYLVGGSSRIPLVARLIQEGLGVTPTTLDQPETSVATGALYLPTGTAPPARAPSAAGSAVGGLGAGAAASGGATAAGAASAAGNLGGGFGGPRTGPTVPWTGPTPAPTGLTASRTGPTPARTGPTASPTGPTASPTGPNPSGAGSNPSGAGPNPSAAGSTRSPGGPPSGSVPAPGGAPSGATPVPQAPRMGGPRPTQPGTRPAAPVPAGPVPAGPVPAGPRPAGPPVGAPGGAQARGGSQPAGGPGGAQARSGVQPVVGPGGQVRSGAHPTGGPAGAPPRGGAQPMGTGARPLANPTGRPPVPTGPARPATGPVPAAPAQLRPINRVSAPPPGAGPAPAYPQRFATGLPGPGGFGPGGAGPGGSGPGGPGPGGPSGRSGMSPKVVGGIAAGVVLLLALVIGSIALSGGGGTDPTPGPTQGLPTSAPRTTPSTEFDSAFANNQVRDYVRPYYSEISSCEKQTDNAGASSAKCTFDDGHQAIFFGLPASVSMSTWRSTLENSLTQLEGSDKGTWSKGAKWTKQETGGAYLYWDEEAPKIGGIIIDSGGTLSDLDSWWTTRWGHSG